MTDTADHGPEGLAVGEPRVDDPGGVVHADHAPDPYEAEAGVDGDFGEGRGVGVEGELLRLRRPGVRAHRFEVGAVVAGQEALVRLPACGLVLHTQPTASYDDVCGVGSVQR